MGLKFLIVIAIHSLLFWGFSSSQDLDCDSNFGDLPPIEVKAFNSIASMFSRSHGSDASIACKKQSGGPRRITCCCKRTSNLSNISCHVTRIFNCTRLEGTIPAALSNFKYLYHLDLSDNKIGGVIPDSLGDLSSLQYLGLGANQLNGSIPNSLGRLKNLATLYLSANFLNGSIPPSFVALENIKYLTASFNNLSGPIPPFLGNLTGLNYLGLGANQFSGTLPPELGNLKNLYSFEVWSNKLSGSIPHEYAQLTSLSMFDVGGNNISGMIPNFIGNWTNLTFLYLFGNNFEGAIPREIFQLPRIKTLWISDLRNSSFEFPSSAILPSIANLVLRNCSIVGLIPPYVGEWPNLGRLDLSFNNLVGGIPDSLQNSSSLSTMILAGNKLNGMFPTWVAKKKSLAVDLTYNKLQVNKSVRAQNVSNMNVFECCSTSNKAIKEINMTELSQSMLCDEEKSNRSSLHINCGGEEISSPDHFYADNDTANFQNYTEGKWAYSCSGQTSDRSNDNVLAAKCGIFDTNALLYDSARYCPVSLTYYGFCLRNGNYTVQLFFLEIAYTEMEDYSVLNERVFDIYIQGILRVKDFNMIEKTGNRKRGRIENITSVLVTDSLLKIQLYWAGKGAFEGNGPLISAISATIPDPVGNKKLSTLQITLIVLASAVFALLLLLLLIWKLCWSGKGELNERCIELLGRPVTVKQIVDGTRNFSPKMEIGKGGFGTVYRAELLNQIVAVKKLSGRSVQGMDEFKNEVYTLKSLKHENLVQLLDGYSGKDLLLLIYEYMENNSLSRALFESSLELNWETRFGICMGIAKGLKYLHEDSRIKIVHRDIKASNILLDGNVKPKISDFGLARLYDKNENQNMATIVGGTRGYMAPEYAMRGIITDKADIYSFGVLLLEIVSGKNNADYKLNQESVFLLDTAYVLHKQGRLMDLVDKKLERYNVEQVRTVLHLGMMCTSQSPSLRPTISQVVSVLEGHNTIEQVAADRAPTPPPAAEYDGNVDTCFTDISYTSTDGASGSSTAYYVIRERGENNRPPANTYPHEISNETSI